MRVSNYKTFYQLTSNIESLYAVVTHCGKIKKKKFSISNKYL